MMGITTKKVNWILDAALADPVHPNPAMGLWVLVSEFLV